MRAPGPPPPGLRTFTAVMVGGAVVLALVLAALGVREGNAARHFSEGRVGTYASGALLVASAALAVAAARRVAGQPFARFWYLAAAGFVFLTLDELTLIHEEIDKWIHARLGWDPNHPVTDQIDAGIVILYGLAAVLWAWRYRDRLLALRWATLLISAALPGFLGMMALDIVGVSKVTEESLKLITEAVIASSLFAAGRDPALADPRGAGVYFRGL